MFTARAALRARVAASLESDVSAAAGPLAKRLADGNPQVRKAAAVLTTSLLAVVLATWLLLVSHPQASLTEALFEVVSAFATCGLTLSFTGDLNLFGQAVIMLMMFWGRLGALTLVVAIAQPHAGQRVSYPEEQILIG